MKIAPKAPGVFRVVLFGESAAAGFPFAPAFTPAIVLESILRARMQEQEVEVLDLAVPNLGPQEQEQRWADALSYAAADVHVYFTGNNWHYGVEAGSADEFRRLLADRARDLAGKMKESAGPARSVVLIPAANHAWERTLPPPWLGFEKTRSWIRIFAAARRALQSEDYPALLGHAAALEGLDDGLTGTAPRLRAFAHAALGQYSQACTAAQAALDRENWHGHAWALPQAAPAVENALREIFPDAILLRDRLAEAVGKPFLGYESFVDQCHLSAQGIRMAMACVASRITEGDWKELLELAPAAPEVSVRSAAFLAAHWHGQFELPFGPSGHVETFLRAAGTDYLALPFLATREALVPAALSPALAETSRLPGTAGAVLFPRLAARFLRSFVAAGGKGLGELAASWSEKLQNGGFDLAEPWFWPDYSERSPLPGSDERQSFPWFEAYWPESRFEFPSTAGSALVATAVLRSGGSGEVKVELNGKALGSFALSKVWARTELQLPAEHLVEGFNTVTFHWPDARADRFFPLFGEIFSLQLLAAAP